MRVGLRILLLVVCTLCLASCQDAEVQIPLVPAGLGVTGTEVTFVVSVCQPSSNAAQFYFFDPSPSMGAA